jgi:hypothetical protein
MTGTIVLRPLGDPVDELSEVLLELANQPVSILKWR